MSSPSRSAARVLPSESKQPDFTSASMTRRLLSRRSTREQKSVSDLNGPSPRRASRTDATAPSPTPLTAPRPKRIASPSGVKDSSDLFTSGGKTGIFISRHVLTYFTTSSELPELAVSVAARNSTAWCTFIQAVRYARSA